MALQIEKSFVLDAPPAAVWEFLTDPHRVARCLPGAALTEQIDERSYAGTITVKVGPVTANYRGKMRFEQLDAEAREAEIVASGQETRGKGGADMRMKSRVTERAGGGTEVTVVSEVNVVGVLAQFGRGMIQDVSDQLFQRFTEAMRRELEAPAAATSTAAAPATAQGAAGAALPGSAAAATAPQGAAAAGAAPGAAAALGAASGAVPPGLAAVAAAAPGAAAPAASARSTAAGAAPAGSMAAASGAAPPGSAAEPSASSAADAMPPGPAAAGVAPPPVRPPASAHPSPPAGEPALDLGSIGTAAAARAAGRTLRRPGFWIAVVALAVIFYWFFLR